MPGRILEEVWFLVGYNFEQPMLNSQAIITYQGWYWISLQHQVWKLMVRDCLGHFGGEYIILMFRVSHSVGIEHLNLKLEIKLCLSC